MAPNDTHRLPPDSLYESIDHVFLEVWETCRPFYALTSSDNFSIDNLAPRLDDALLLAQCREKIDTSTTIISPKLSVSFNRDENKGGNSWFGGRDY